MGASDRWRAPLVLRSLPIDRPPRLERADITDPRVRKLADGIIAAQRREIAEMEDLIVKLERGE